jgi:hypothetical protein
MVFDDGFGYTQKIISRQGMRYDEYSCMWAMLIEELNGQADKVISIPGDKTSALRRGSIQLLNI